MLEVVRLGAGYTTAIQNLGKSDYQLMQPRTPTFLTKLSIFGDSVISLKPK